MALAVLIFSKGFGSRFQNPDCFAFQLTFTFAYTSSSCFMNLEKIIAMILNNETQESIMERILSGNDMKSTVDKFVVYRVIIISLFPDLFLF